MSWTLYPPDNSELTPTTPTTFTQGSVLFAGAAGVLSQNNTSLNWDDANTQLRLQAGAATKTPLLVKGFAAQSANLQEWQSSAAAILASIRADGGLYSAKTGYSPTAGFFTSSNGSNIATSADGTFWFTSSTAASCTIDAGNLALLVGSNFKIGWTDTTNVAAGAADTGFARIAASIIKVTNGSTGAGALEFLERTAPSAATANSVRIYAQDNGAGKTQLMALFATGASQQIAIEP